MKLFNTLTNKKEDFVPIHPGKVSIYACGPTVYNLIHIGNARMACVFDTLRRYLQWRGFEVTFVQNFTDVDDKIIRRAAEEGVSEKELANRYIAEYLTDSQGLNILPASIAPRATETIDEIISLISDLEEKGFAYTAEDGVYFEVDKFEGYGRLSRQPLDDLVAGARVDSGEKKRSPVDFALWKSSKPGEPAWASPWGEGRPGWHIECSAMVRKHLGLTIDIHCGGSDLVFPHHENEIAQSECANGCMMANYWLHNGFINVDNKKMSKSAGNFFVVRDVAAEYGYEPVRFLSIASHYRSPINYSTEILEQNIAALQRLYACRDNLAFVAKNAAGGEADPSFAEKLSARRQQFTAEMEDDFNTAGAIGILFELARDINIHCSPERSPSSADCCAAAELFGELCGVLGLLYVTEGGCTDAEIEALVALRTAAKKEKNYAEADRIREQLKEMGVTLEDTPLGTRWCAVRTDGSH